MKLLDVEQDTEHCCARCRKEYSLRDGQDPTKYCDQCAHIVADQADALAKALGVANGALISAAHYGGMFGSQLGDNYREASNVVRAALAAYRKTSS